ncbi:cell division protein ZipA [Moritella sp. Urea-trap-13]|uniref:cell division protein ZipA n=1 Tax=Moritella sp. Urea-trap-13 TaxID=2058327 RepID=UPI000C32D408|nr:cell division protein ZipA [Moritella sp. Urea-trap-13]PKH07898.1 cell division protein ZipA [Moritella sp. Urea-trap-13]
MQDLRLVLIILGFIAIAALITHGLWSNKKNQVKPLKDKPLKKLDQNVKDNQGFDLDGIGDKRVVTKSVEPTMNFESDKPAPVSVGKIEPQFSAVNSSSSSSRPLKNNEPQASTDAAPTETIVTASFSAIDVEMPTVTENAETVERVKSDLSYDVVDDAENVAIDAEIDVVIDNSLAADEQQQSASLDAANDSAQDEAVEEAVFVINIMAREGKSIAGAELLQELSAFGFKFGEMDIFHRHVDAAGKGAVIFSLANMVKPGTFDIDTMEQFESPGVSLFMMFPCAGKASHNYGLMLSAAERIADGVDGLLMDATRHPLTEDAIEQEQVFIRKLENRSLAK